jgi:NAD(P)-dependent dehydrogenase (short-subunit alcohol dehydrogenase family)
MELGLTGKVALVTGSSRGIGRGIAEAFASEGCDLLLTGRDKAALEEVATSIRSKGRKVAVIVTDLRDPGAPQTLVAAVEREFGGLDILINNAGTTKRGDFFALTDADWEDGYALKFFAHVRLARAAWPLLKERRGSLVTIGGTSGRKRRSGLPSAVLSMPRSPPLPSALPISARRMVFRSIVSIRAWWKPSGNGGAFARKSSAPASRRKKSVRSSVVRPASPVTAP